MSGEDFSRTVRDLDAAKRRSSFRPVRVTLTRAYGGSPVSVLAATCLDAAFDQWALLPGKPIVLWIGREPAWRYKPCRKLAPRDV